MAKKPRKSAIDREIEAHDRKLMEDLGINDFLREEEDKWRDVLEDPDAEWRKKPPSEKQLARLKEYGIRLPRAATRGHASTIIDQIKAGKIKKPRGRMFYIKWIIFIVAMLLMAGMMLHHILTY